MLKVNRNLMYLVVALGLGAVAAFAAVQYIQGEVSKRTHQGETTLTQVAVPTQDMDTGTVITEDVLAIREVPAEFVPADAVTPENYTELMGRMLRAPVREGAPLGSSALVPIYDQFSRVIEAGNVGYTLQVDETNSISGMIAPGDRVDVLLLVDDERRGGRVLPLLQDIIVLATGTRVGESPADEQGYSTLTFELQPSQAEKLTVANKAGSLRVMLRQREDRGAFGLDGLTVRDLLGGAGGSRRGGGGVEFIIGGKG